MPHIIYGHIQEYKFCDVLLDELKVRISPEVGNIVDRASDKVIDSDDFVTASEQEVGQM